MRRNIVLVFATDPASIDDAEAGNRPARRAQAVGERVRRGVAGKATHLTPVIYSR